MKTYLVEVNKIKFSIRSTGPAEAAKKAINAALAGMKDTPGLTITVKVEDTPNVRRLD